MNYLGKDGVYFVFTDDFNHKKNTKTTMKYTCRSGYGKRMHSVEICSLIKRCRDGKHKYRSPMCSKAVDKT